MEDIIGRVVDVKVLREQRAQDELRRQRYALEEAVREVDRRRRAAKDYRQWRIAEERRLYDGIEGKLLRLVDLEHLKEDIGVLRSKEFTLQQKTEEAEAARLKVAEEVKVAEVGLEHAVKAREKFEELFDVVQSEAQLERDRAEENELDEQFRLEPEDEREVTA